MYRCCSYFDEPKVSNTVPTIISNAEITFALDSFSLNIIIPSNEPIRILVLRSAETYAIGPEETASK